MSEPVGAAATDLDDGAVDGEPVNDPGTHVGTYDLPQNLTPAVATLTSSSASTSLADRCDAVATCSVIAG